MSLIFETERLRVRSLRPDDLDDFHEMQGNPNVMRHVDGKAMSLTESRADLKRLIDLYSVKGNDFWVWAVVHKPDAAFLGTCALILNDDDENEIGFRFQEKHWGQGYGQEVCRATLQYGLRDMGLKSIFAYVDKENIASVKILERSMNFEKEFYNEEEKCIDRKYVLHASPPK